MAILSCFTSLLKINPLCDSWAVQDTGKAAGGLRWLLRTPAELCCQVLTLPQCSPMLTFGHLHCCVDSRGWVCGSPTKFLNYIFLCCNRPVPDLHTGAVEKKRIRAITPLCCYYKDFSSGAGCSYSFRLSQPCLSHSTFSVQQMPFQFNEQNAERKRPMDKDHYIQKLACLHKSSR